MLGGKAVLKTRIVWEAETGDSVEVSSGPGEELAIQNVTITECVNSEKELSPGAVCAGLFEAKILAVSGSIPLQAGTTISVYRHDGVQECLTGVYTVDNLQQVTAHSVKITGYDFVTKLDKDLTSWLRGVNGWPYTLLAFANMVCGACGLKLSTENIPNGELLVNRFTMDHVTGRQLMQWVGQLCCRFCRICTDDHAAVELDWYKPSGKTIEPSGELYYLQNDLSFEDYAVAPVDAVQIRMSGTDGGALWPEAAENANSYIITGNPLLSGSLQDDIVPALQSIQAELAGFSYTPCKVTIPACPDLRPGHTVTVTAKSGKKFTTCVMTKVQSGQKDTLESFGSYRRDAAGAGKSTETQYAEAAAGAARQAAASAEKAAQSATSSANSAANAAQDAVNRMTHEEIFNKLTKGGEIQGIYVQDNKWYINAEVAKIVNLIVDHVRSVSGSSVLDIVGATLQFLSNGKATISLENMFEGLPVMYMTDYENGVAKDNCELSPHHLNLGGTSMIPTFSISALNGKVRMWLNGENTAGKVLSWKDNGDGTFTLIGS